MNNESNILRGAKNALLSSILYYYRALELEGCKDIKQKIATDVSLSLKLSKEQTEFIENTEILNTEETIDDIIFLINNLKCNNNDTKNLIINSLNNLKKKIIKI